jgi:hypothetical protein
MVSFDVMSLITELPVKKTMDLLGCHFEEGILGLFCHILTNSYITFNEQFYGQTDGMVMDSLLSPVIEYFYMEDYKSEALELAPLKPRYWFRYVDDAFVIWPHSWEKLEDFLHHLNIIHQSVQFTTETESEGDLAFLDIDIYGRPDGSMGHKVYRKPTHTPICTSTPSPITTHPINKWYYPL